MRSRIAGHAVLVLQPVQQHVELQHAHRADDRRGPDGALGVEDLHRALLGELPQPGVELLALERVADADAREVLRAEARDAAELEVAVAESESPTRSVPRSWMPITSPG
jgi:hypothetical protein